MEATVWEVTDEWAMEYAYHADPCCGEDPAEGSDTDDV
ncbi:hypothetical protein Marky_1614 [Marinithermus hydrothermalis DSM 14884]|uniref:Uncharacterized protein n=1 Tax=Marinithermus hydrothermalis (strain DSM 14884 / JCM 11576 / T1) TaxID=869210 RepID=F2NKA0_MARHT|nr:hypothetical protein Marky_1614 [Marinithermus hydrothermalis DSM 14884]